MALTKEAYKKLNDNTNGIRFIRPFSEYTLQEVIEALTELEELKNDVARYFELEGNYQKSLHEYHEMEHIKNKIMKVGNEE